MSCCPSSGHAVRRPTSPGTWGAPAGELDAMATACSLSALGLDLVGHGRPDEAFGAVVAAVRSVPHGSCWPADPRAALRELVFLLLDGSVTENIRTSAAGRLDELFARSAGRLASRTDRLFCLIGLGVNGLSRGEAARSLAVAAELRAVAGGEAGCGPLHRPGLRAVALLGSAVIRQQLGQAAVEVHEATHLLLRLRAITWTGRRRLLSRSLLMAAGQARAKNDLTRALNSASAAVGQARGLRAGFRAVILAEALTGLSAVLGDLGRHGEAIHAAVEAVDVAASAVTWLPEG